MPVFAIDERDTPYVTTKEEVENDVLKGLGGRRLALFSAFATMLFLRCVAGINRAKKEAVSCRRFSSSSVRLCAYACHVLLFSESCSRWIFLRRAPNAKQDVMPHMCRGIFGVTTNAGNYYRMFFIKHCLFVAVPAL